MSARSINGFCELPSGTVNTRRPAPPVNCLVETLPTEERTRSPSVVKLASEVSSSSNG